MQPPKTMKLRRLLTGEEIEAVQAKKKARVDTQHKNVQARRAINTENLRHLAQLNNPLALQWKCAEPEGSAIYSKTE